MHRRRGGRGHVAIAEVRLPRGRDAEARGDRHDDRRAHFGPGDRLHARAPQPRLHARRAAGDRERRARAGNEGGGRSPARGEKLPGD